MKIGVFTALFQNLPYEEALDRAVAAGASLYISGEVSEQTVHEAREQGIVRHLGISGHAEPNEVSKIGILGGGLMGAGIASVSVLKAAKTVRIKEVEDAGIQR